MRRLILLVALSGCTQSTALVTDGGAPPVGDVNSAATKYPDLRTFWSRSVARTCGPNSGVCHDNRQFPDMQRASGLLDAVGQRCNQIRTDPATIDNLCEPQGDLLKIGSFQTRIGRVAATASTVIIALHDAVPPAQSGAMAVLRQPPNLSPLSFPIPAAAVLSASGASVTLDRTMLPTAMADFLAPALPTPGDANQVVVGDPNGDGIYGAELGGALIKPGDPLKSYLFLRVLSPLGVGGNPMTSMTAPPSNEAQMPIANFQYWDIDNDLTALWCWISTMKPDGSNADGPIDYASCDTTNMPRPQHQGGEATTFSSVYADILVPNCRSCHSSGTRQPTTFYMDDLRTTYDLLLGIRGSGPSESRLGLPFVTRDDPSSSYLVLKITGDPSIDGARMPLDGELPADAIDAIQTWIAQGANDD